MRHIKRFDLLFVGLLCALTSSAAHALERDKLRLLVPLPSFNVEFGFNWRAPDALPEVSDEVARGLIIDLQKTTAAGTGATDAAAFGRLGQLLAQVKDPASQTAFETAVGLRRQQVAAHPDDANAMLLLGRALESAGHPEEAETVLRRTVVMAPQSGAAWTALGGVLSLQAHRVILPDGTSVTVGGLQLPQAPGVEAALRARPSEADIARAQTLLDEAKSAYDRAVEVAPQSADSYGERVGFRLAGGLLRSVLQNLKSDVALSLRDAISRSISTFGEAALSLESSLDYRQMARLSPDDVQTLGASALSEISRELARRATNPATANDLNFGEALRDLPPDSRAAILFSVGRMQVLAQNPDAKVAAPALEALGVLQSFLGQTEAAETALRRAIALDASREQAWDALLNLMIGSGRFSDMVTLQQARLAKADTARNHLLLAKAYDKLNQPAQVEAQVRAAAERAPGDPTTTLALIFVLLRRDDASLPQAAQLLNRLPTLTGKTSNFFETERALASAFNLALSGQEADARQLFAQVLAQDPGSDVARNALTLLPAPPA